LRRMFQNPKEAALKTWRDDERKVAMMWLHTRSMVLCGNALMQNTENLAKTQGIYGSAWAPMEWIRSMRWLMTITHV
jgi:hypothetical protein